MLAYFQFKILKARACGFESPHSQLIQVYSGIEIYLKRDLYEPSDSTTISRYRALLEEKEELWHEAYQPRQPTPPNALTNQSRNAYRPQSRPNLPWRQQSTLPNRSQTQNQNQQQYRNVLQTQRGPLCPVHLMRGQNIHHTADQCRLLKDALDVVSKSSNKPNSPTQNNS